MTADHIIRKKVATHISPELHKAFGILLQIDDTTMDEFLRREIEKYVSEHQHANAVAHIIREPKNPSALEAIAKIHRRRSIPELRPQSPISPNDGGQPDEKS